MKNFSVLISILIGLSFVQCQLKTNQMNLNNSNNIEKVLINQLLEGAVQYSTEYDLEIPKDDFSKDDFDASVYFSEKILSSNTYKNPDNLFFYKKIEAVFGRVLDSTSTNTYLYVNFLDKCYTEFNSRPQDGIDVLGTYIIKNKNFIMDFHFIPQLIDYQNKYPQVAAVEDTMSTERGEKKIYQWKELSIRDDDYSLKKERALFVNQLIHRNKYLFNDSKFSLTWLINNDSNFLITLLKVFGYDEEQKINELALKDTYDFYFNNGYKRVEKCDNLFFTRSCQNKFKIHRGILKTIADQTSQSECRYIEMIFSYLQSICNKVHIVDITQDELAKLVCIYGRLEVDLRKKGFTLWSTYSGITSLLDNDLREIARRNNYYNITNFQEVLDVIDQEYPYVNDGDESARPFDYDTLKGK